MELKKKKKNITLRNKIKHICQFDWRELYIDCKSFTRKFENTQYERQLTHAIQ